MKPVNIFALPVFLIIALGGCRKSFLDVENTSQFFRQTYVKDLNSMEEFMNGVHVNMNTMYANAYIGTYPEIVADNLKPLPSGTQIMMAQYNWAQIASNAMEYSPGSSTATSICMNSVWTSGYLITRACNFILEDIGKYRDEDPVRADMIKAQALAIRAVVYFRMVNVFAQPYGFTPEASHAGIPYITTSDITDPYSRQSVAEVYNYLISDLTTAIQLLPATIANTRYMNQAAAKAFLARIYLFKEDYDKARALAMEICQQFPMLTIAKGYPNDLFKDRQPDQSEVLYRFTPMNQPGVVASFMGRNLRGNLRRFVATNDIAAILRENLNDIRSNWVTDVAGVWNVVKFPANSTPEIVPAPIAQETAYYMPAIRSTEMFLTVAEAAFKKGDENSARIYIDSVRKRANPSIVPVTATGPALLDSICKERRKELAFEELRLFDLQRWKRGIHRVDALTGSPKDLPYPGERAISPIPLQDITLAGLRQNSGY